MNPALTSLRVLAGQAPSLQAGNAAWREQVAGLRRHLSECNAARGRFFRAAVIAENFHAFVAPRFVTTVASISILLVFICSVG